MNRRIFVAIPLMNEFENLQNLIEYLSAQDFQNFEVWFCVNQVEDWWEDREKISICEDNQKSLEYLKNITQSPITIVDRSSKGKGWDKKNFGVGWARKVIMDEISKKADDHDIILTLDGDTRFRSGYFSSIVERIQKYPKAVALSVPYYHNLTGDEQTDRNILRYEIYMRYYSLNLWRIQNPYNFTALGSAIAVPNWAYKRVRGITPHKSGEDFYFLLKLKKFGEIIQWNSEKVYPAARYSDRVFFGTGPAMIKGKAGDWSSYPIYHYQLFDEVQKTFEAFSNLFDREVDFPMKAFLNDHFCDEQWFLKLRKNNPKKERFVKACQDKVDALRILQFLKASQKGRNESDEQNLMLFFEEFYADSPVKDKISNFDFDKSRVEDLNAFRDFLMNEEEKYQHNVWK